ncbi:hypothetical protein P43SY_006334 [Pythium insidiosum]|uniref:HTH La-type RNA-binding domain-containing protein n=1 Tax=Pythium insidiosum TaxID=114742 RepID=A0AAD5LAM6_PYTIN|nr:hypothetical protein P43SY_006334 [Pythium insidiosum]
METQDIDVMAQLASHYYSFGRNRSRSAPIPPAAISSTWQYAEEPTTTTVTTPSLPPPIHIMAPVDMDATRMGPIGSQLATSTISELQNLHLSEPENEPSNAIDAMAAAASAAVAAGAPLPATFLRTICDQLEFYFCDENLLGDLFLLKNMNMDGYVKLDLLASFGRVKKLTTDLEQIRKSLELSTKLIMNEDQSMVCRKDPLPQHQTYHGKLARTAIAYNLPEDASVASLRETFSQCGEITYLRLLKKNSTTGRNAVLKPPIVAGETYAIIEFVDDEMAKHAVLTLSDSYNWRTGMQVVLFDGTNSEKLKQKMFPVEVGDRRRAKSTSAVTRPVHVEAVGEGLDELKEGKVSTGTVYSIRGAGGLITPTRLDTACISFRLIPDEDGNMDIRPGDYVSFTVGKNKKSGRKYASKVKLEFRPPSSLTTDTTPSSQQKDYFAGSPSRWESRNRSATVGAPTAQPVTFRGRSSSSGSRPKLNLSSPRLSTSPPNNSFLGGAPNAATSNSGSPLYRQALGPDGTRGFGSRRTGDAELPAVPKFSPHERRRSHSSSAAMQR